MKIFRVSILTNGKLHPFSFRAILNRGDDENEREAHRWQLGSRFRTR
jgi:hypothetical protein